MSGTGVNSNAGAGPSRQPQKPPAKNPPVVTPGSGNNIIVNQRQASTLQLANAGEIDGGCSGRTPCLNA